MTVELIHGDCLEVLAGLEFGSVDHILADPPYEGEAHTKGRRLRGKSDRSVSSGRIIKTAPLEFPPITEACREECKAHFGRIATRWWMVFCQVEAVSKRMGDGYRRTCVWTKPDARPQLSGDRPAVGFEPCTICHAQGPMKWNGGGLPATWTHNISKGTARPDHPCPKPLPLMLELVRLFTDPGDTILDPFMGSGTTGVACVELGRNFIGIEKDKKWFDVAQQRIESARFRPSLDFARKAKQRKAKALL